MRRHALRFVACHGARRALVRMTRVAVSALVLAAGPGAAQELSGLARLDVAQSEVRDARSGLEVELYLSQPVPWRVFTLDDPRRLVLDFREVDWRGASRAAMLNADRATDVRFGALRPGWSRMVVDLAEPLAVEEAGMAVGAVDGTAHLLVRLDPVPEADYAARAGAPEDPDWAFLLQSDPTAAVPTEADDGMLTVVIDPGHGGLDPGAEHGGVSEAAVMLQLGLELREALARVPGVRPVLTREADDFVPLSTRMSIARAAGADLFISLHADALEGLQATGASVYTLTDAALEEASLRMAERHERGDLLAGLDLSGQDDTVAMVLMDLARMETAPAGNRFADALISTFEDLNAPLNNRPRRQAPLAVLNAADFPSVLLEVGFLSNDADRARLTSAAGRAAVIDAVVLAILEWAANEEALAPLIRQ